MKNISGETKFFIGIIFATVIILTGAVVIFSRPEKPVSADILVRPDSQSTGSAQPKATLVEFSDFECPACITAYPYVKDVTAKYTQDLKFVYRHFPLEQHQEAMGAAAAAEAAGLQGKFWEMHDLLFKNQGDLSDESINKIATDLKLDMNKFNADKTSSIITQKIQNDINDAISLKINATPTFFLNGVRLKLLNLTDLETDIKKALGK